MPYSDNEQLKAYHREYYRKNKQAWVDKRNRLTDDQKKRMYEWMAIYRLKTVYGMSEEQYCALFQKQNGKCAICGTDKVKGRAKRLHVDHCHSTDRIRGLLCMRCNTALGWYEKNAVGIAAYLQNT